MVLERTYVHICFDDRKFRTTKLVFRIVFLYKNVLNSTICIYRYKIFQIMRWKIQMHDMHRPYSIIESRILIYRQKVLEVNNQLGDLEYSSIRQFNPVIFKSTITF